jgi:hypothetical protein
MTTPTTKTPNTKKAYAEPAVEEYGALKDLTTGGTTGSAEGASSSPQKRA